ncbi:MAG TPA: caspase family protein [Polyangiaceae bacterium]|nr:caspase family protein [Polyangiaceae bacterium]
MAKRAWFAFLLSLLFALPAAAEPPEVGPGNHASFALIIGVNRSVDKNAPLLRYADDDAARYLDLFRTLGAKSYVLARLDDNTRRLHPQVAAEALQPRLAEYRQVIRTLAADIEQARKRGVKTSLYFVYAGHGNVKSGRGYITLEDGRLHGDELESEMLAKIKPDQEHFIVDACHSYFLTVGRGPGGKRREAHGFTQLGGLLSRPTTGLLFSTSSAKESHEWAGFQAGVFSHEVRSGLYGAADADGNGRVSYKEIAAFIQRANASVANERYRPDVYVRPPKNTDVLVDLSPKLGARIDFSGARGDHHLLEDERGVRYADFHNDGGKAGYLLKPRTGGKLYLRRLSDENEVVVPLAPAVVTVAELAPEQPRIAQRGAANDAFESLFGLPFNQRVVDGFQFRTVEPVRVDTGTTTPEAGPGWRTLTGWSLIGLGAIGAGVGTYSLVQAEDHKDTLGANPSHAEVAAANERISSSNLRAGVGFAVAGGAAASGVLLLLWPEERLRVEVDPARGQAMVGLRETF